MSATIFSSIPLIFQQYSSHQSRLHFSSIFINPAYISAIGLIIFINPASTSAIFFSSIPLLFQQYFFHQSVAISPYYFIKPASVDQKNIIEMKTGLMKRILLRQKRDR